MERILKTSTIIIKTCHDCPFCDTSGDGGMGMTGLGACAKTHEFVVASKEPPDFCPLDKRKVKVQHGSKGIV